MPWASTKGQQEDYFKKPREDDDFIQALQKSSGHSDYRKHSKASFNNDWKPAESHKPDDVLDESSIHKESEGIMWPSAAEKKEPISWMSKPKEQREREIEQELDDNYDRYLQEERQSDERQQRKPIDFDERPIKPKPRPDNFDERPIKAKPAAEV